MAAAIEAEEAMAMEGIKASEFALGSGTEGSPPPVVGVEEGVDPGFDEGVFEGALGELGEDEGGEDDEGGATGISETWQMEG